MRTRLRRETLGELLAGGADRVGQPSGEVRLERRDGDVPVDGGYMGVREVLVDALNERADELDDAARPSGGADEAGSPEDAGRRVEGC